MARNEVKASLRVLELNETPKDHATLKAAFRKQVRKTHPDVAGTDDGKPVIRVYRAYEVLKEALDEADKPVIRVKFGEGEYQYAKVSKIEEKEVKGCKYVTALKWFMGMTMSVNNGEWQEILEPESFVAGNTWVYIIK